MLGSFVGIADYGAIIAAIIAASAFLCGLTSVLLTCTRAERIRANPKISTVLEKAAGLTLIGFGIKRAISR